MINSQMAKHKASEISEDDFQCIFYKEVDQNRNELLIYYWIVNKNALVFIRSFTINKDNELTKDNDCNGHSFEENPKDPAQYERAILKILKESK